jgi:hypothetical protein
MPVLSIRSINVVGKKPSSRTGHACVNYKERLMIIVGGEGAGSDGNSILFNDLWSFDIRTNNWSEIIIENKN